MGVGHAGGASGNSKYAGAAATPSTHAGMYTYARDRMSSGTEATTMNEGGKQGDGRGAHCGAEDELEEARKVGVEQIDDGSR